MEKLTRQEEEIMLHIWRLGPCFIRDIREVMPDPKPPYTSIASVVRNLERKEYVTPTKYGVITQYAPAVPEYDYKQLLLRDVAENYFKGSYKKMVSFFVNNRELSENDLRDLIGQIEKGE